MISELPNDFYNGDGLGRFTDTLTKVTVGLKEVVKDKGKVETKDEEPKETLILGMHPMTLVILSAGVLVLAITGVIIYKKYNK